jgi:hypothetical protein
MKILLSVANLQYSYGVEAPAPRVTRETPEPAAVTVS